MKIFREKDQRKLILTAANIVQSQIKELAKTKKTITLGLVGGRSVSEIYIELSKRDSKSWSKIHFFIIDERNVPITDNESNFKLIKESLLDPLLKRKQITNKNIHPLDTSLDPNIAKVKYSEELSKFGKCFDIAILSSGEDNHIAAIFPKFNYPNNEMYTYFTNSPKLPPQRFTATPSLMEKTKFAIVMFIGSAKKAALNHFLDKKNIKTLPEKTLLKINKLNVFTDLEE